MRMASAGMRGGQPAGDVEAPGQPLFPEQHLDHHQRGGLGTGDQILHGGDGAGPGALRDGLSLSAEFRRSGRL